MNKDDLTVLVPLLIICWVTLSVLGSSAKMDRGNCGKTFPIGYVLYLDLFCEVK